MSLQDITIDLDNLSFEIPRRPADNNFDGSIYKEVVPPAITIQRAVKNRNRRCIPSDDEESEDEDDDQSIVSTEENDFSPTPRVHPALKSNTPVAVSVPAKKPIRKSQPLPSDDEDSEDDEDEDDEEEQMNRNNVSRKYNQKDMQNAAYQPVQTNTVEALEDDEDDDNEALLANRDPNAGPILTLVEGSHLQQLHQMQQYHQQKLALFQNQIQPSKSNSSNIRRQQHGSGGRTMSGMDLLVQLEQEKADSKRMKPKVVHKLEGLLGRLPEPGSHNISFQQVQQQQQQQQQRIMQNQHHYYQQQQLQLQQQRGYLDPNIQQQLHHHHYQQQQQMQLQQQLQLQQQQQQQAYHYNTSRSPSPIHHRSLSPNPHIRSPSPNTRTQPHRNNRTHN